jgi:hypothetical protein
MHHCMVAVRKDHTNLERNAAREHYIRQRKCATMFAESVALRLE